MHKTPSPLKLIANSLVDEVWSDYVASVKANMHGSDAQKQGILRRRILKFFQNCKMDEKTYYVQRKEITTEVNPESFNFNVLILYGIDFLSEAKVKSYFQPYEVGVKMVDDSHCIIGFDNLQDLLKALFLRLLQKQGNFQEFRKILGENIRQLVKWREVVGYQEMCFDRKLWARFALKEELLNWPKVYGKSKDAFIAAKKKIFKKVEQVNKKKIQQHYGLDQRRTPKIQVGCCAKRTHKFMEAKSASCQHRGKPINQRSRTRQRKDERGRGRGRGYYRGRGNGPWIDRQELQPLDIIKDIVNPGSTEFKSGILQNVPRKGILKKTEVIEPDFQVKDLTGVVISDDADVSNDSAFMNLMTQLQGYQISEKKEQSEKGSSLILNKSRYQIYGEDDDDIS